MKRDGTRLARVKGEPVFGGGHTRVLLELPGEMTLITEARSRGDISERCGGRSERTAREFHPDLSNVAPERRPVKPPERAREVHRVDANASGHRGQRQRLGEV